MPRKLPLHVTKERSRHKKVKFYFRRFKGPRIRLPDDPDSPEFERAYIAALAGRQINPPDNPQISSHSLRWLIAQYMESGAWKALAAVTRGDRGAIYKQIIQNSGKASFTAIDRKDILAGMESRSATPAQANNFLKAMRGLFKWAHLQEHVKEDPTMGVEGLTYKTDGFPAWTIDDLKKFYEKWPIGTKPRLAVELILHSGLRRSDIVRAGPQYLKGNIFSMQTRKTGATITVEFPDTLLAVIDATETGKDHFITWEDGKPYTDKGFGSWFRVQCDAAGVTKSAHGIRKLSATLSADGGAAAHELMAQYGWTNVKQAEIYTKGADRKALGIRSSRRIVSQIDSAIPRTDSPKVRDKSEKE